MNDVGNIVHRVTEDFSNGDGQSLEQLIRVVLSRNINMVMIIPEIYIRIIVKENEKYRIQFCNNEKAALNKIHNDLAQHYDISAILQVIHVPCTKLRPIWPTLSIEEQKTIAESYQLIRHGKLDTHPSQLVHSMLAEFLLYYVLTTAENNAGLLFETNDKEGSFLKMMPSPFYKGTKLLEKDYHFQCIPRRAIQNELLINHIPFEVNSTSRTVLLPAKQVELSFGNQIQFRSPSSRCGGKGHHDDYQIELLVFFQLCHNCSATDALVEATFQFKHSKVGQDDIQVGPILSHLRLPFVGSRTKIVQRTVPINSIESKRLLTPIPSDYTLSKLDIKFNRPFHYSLGLSAFVIEYKCS